MLSKQSWSFSMTSVATYECKQEENNKLWGSCPDLGDWPVCDWRVLPHTLWENATWSQTEDLSLSGKQGPWTSQRMWVTLAQGFGPRAIHLEWIYWIHVTVAMYSRDIRFICLSQDPMRRINFFFNLPNPSGRTRSGVHLVPNINKLPNVEK
jgi:hypothetical protein